MMKIGIGIGDIAGAPAGVDGLIAQARRAEAEGFASGWFANIMGMDAIMAAALCARETGRIELGTAVVPTFPRHPHAMAQPALSAQAITWMTGPKTIREHTAPRIREAAAQARRPAPRVVVGLPVAVTKDVAGARAAAAQAFLVYGALPSYRAMLDREGAEGPADVAVVGDESAVGEQLRRLAEAGATDFLAAPFAVPGDGDAVERTRALLAKLAAAGVG